MEEMEKQITVELSQMDIVRIAYLAMDMHKKFHGADFEEVNCYHSCVRIAQQLLSQVSAAYLKRHPRVTYFYNKIPVNADALFYYSGPENGYPF